MSIPLDPNGIPSGSSITNAPDTTSMPGLVFMTWNAARNTLPVVLSYPGNLSVSIAVLHHQAAKVKGLAVVRRASSIVIPFFLRSSKTAARNGRSQPRRQDLR